MTTAPAQPAVPTRAAAAPPHGSAARVSAPRRRPSGASAAALASVAVAAVAVAVASWSGPGRDSLMPAPTAPGSAGTTADAPALPGEGVAGLVEDGRDRGFLRTVDERPDGPTLVLDRAVLLSGAAADAEAAARGEESPVPNDVLVLNEDPQLREYPVSPDAAVHLTVGLAPVESIDVPVASSLAELRGLLPPPSDEPISGYLFDVVVEDGVVVALDHVYLP